MKELVKIAKSLFTGWFIFMWIALYSTLWGAYILYISKSPLYTLIMALIGGIVTFYSVNIINEIVDRRNKELNEVNKYVTYVVFYLKIGKNVYDSFYEARNNMPDTKIYDDISIAMDSLITEGTLEMQHFKKYNFQALDVFHSNLVIKHVQGGKSKEIFRTTTADMNTELNFRNQLYVNKKYILQQVWMMLVMTLAVPAIVTATSGAMYIKFLNVIVVAYPVLTVFLGGCYALIFFMKRNFTDLSVSEM